MEAYIQILFLNILFLNKGKKTPTKINLNKTSYDHFGEFLKIVYAHYVVIIQANNLLGL
jgi:hypothetical protein